MSDEESAPKTIPSLKDTGEAMTEDEQRRKTESPGEGHPVGDTSAPNDAPGADNGHVTPPIADDAEKGQTESPAEYPSGR
jgi:hypothetical protein